MFNEDKKPRSYGVLFKRAKRLLVGLPRTGGRNSFGRITAFKKGGGSVRLLRFVDFWRRLRVNAFIVRFEKDSFRSANLSLVFYQTGFLSYIILPDGYSIGDRLDFSCPLIIKRTKVTELFTPSPIFVGNSIPLSFLSNGSLVFNVELLPYKGAQICRSAGTSAVLLNNIGGFVTLKLRSGWKIVLSEKCYATIGSSPNAKHMYSVLGKAGLVRNLGRRPTVRGVAMNAIDHPHGGGRGKTSGGPRPLTPWGKITKQQRTVSKKTRLRLLKIRFR